MRQANVILFLAIVPAVTAQTIPFDGYDVQVRSVDRTNWVYDAMWNAAHRQAALHENREVRAPQGQRVLEIRITFDRKTPPDAPQQFAFEKSGNIFTPKSIGRLPRSKFRVEGADGKVLEWGGLSVEGSIVSAGPLAAQLEKDRREGRPSRAEELDIREVVSQVVAFNKNFTDGWTQLLFAVPPDFDTSSVKVFLDGQEVPRKPAKKK